MLKIEFYVVLLLFLVPVTYAKDVSVQQAGYNNALQKMERAEEEYKADSRAVAETEKILINKNKRLTEERSKAELSKSKYIDAKGKLEEAQAALDRAWKD